MLKTLTLNHHWQALRTLVSGLGGHADVEIETLRR